MKTPIMSAVVAMLLVVSLISGCKKSTPEAAGSTKTKLLESDACTELWTTTLKSNTDSKSQGLEYLGGKMETFTSPWSLKETNNGIIHLQSQVTFKNGISQKADAYLTPADLDTTNPTDPKQQTYQVRIESGACSLNPCEGEQYTSTQEERNQFSSEHLSALNGKALKVLGAWNGEKWSEHDSSGKPVYNISCLSGAIAKCAHWGFVPGAIHKSGTPLTPYYQACVPAARAMYKKTIESFTCPSKEINIYDNLNIMLRTQDFKLESLWGQDGLICLNHARFPYCDAFLHEELKSGPCKDPVPTARGTWPSGYDRQVLIAVAGEQAPVTPGGKCPNISKAPNRCGE